MSLSFIGLPSSHPATRSHAIPKAVPFALIAGAAVFAVVLWMPVVLIDPDTLWHIKTGEWILANGRVPMTDTWSFTAFGHPWMAHEWLSEVILATIYGWSGWNGVMVMTASAFGSAIGIVALHVRRTVQVDIAVMLVLLAITCGWASLLARPHLIALPIVALWTAGLVAARARGTAPPLYLLPLMTVWANLHGGFMLGLALTGALGVEAVFDPLSIRRDAVRGWGLFLFGAVIAALITPHGIGGLLFPFRLMAMRDLYQIQEWKPSDFSHLNGVALSILLGLYLGLSGIVRLPKFRVLLLTGLVFVTMQHARNAQLFGVIAPLLVAGALGRNGNDRMPSSQFAWTTWAPMGLVAAVAMGSVTFRIAVPVEREDAGYYASAAIAHIPAELLARPVLNEYGFGGLLIFNDIRPFVDGRADLYGDEFLDTYHAVMQANGDALGAVLCQYRIEWTMFKPESVVPALMDRTPGWHRLYSDKVAVIHVRDQDPGNLPCPSSIGG
jgi:hypothetical protein